jgi:hypothetical protein
LNIIGNIDLVIVHLLPHIAEHFQRVILKGIEELNFIKDLKQAGKFKNNIKIHSYHYDWLKKLYGYNVATILIDDVHTMADLHFQETVLDCYKHIAIKPECKNAGHLLINSSGILQNIKFLDNLGTKVYYLTTSLQDVKPHFVPYKISL